MVTVYKGGMAAAMATTIRYRSGWSGRRDSNSRPSAWEADALPLSYSRSRARIDRRRPAPIQSVFQHAVNGDTNPVRR